MKKKIGNIEYNIIPLPPYLSSAFRKAVELLKALQEKPPKSIEEDRQCREETKIWMLEVLKETVEPEPKKEHYLELWNILCDITNQVAEDAQFFRKPKRPDTGESKSISHSSAQAPK